MGMDETPNGKRGWREHPLRWRLVCALPFGLLLASALGGCSAKPSVVDEVKQLGGKVVIDEKSPGKPVIGVSLSQAPVTDAWLEHLKGQTQLQALNLAETPISDAGLEHLQGLTQLQSLDLRETKVTDAGLEGTVQGLAQLQSLELWGTNISDAGLGTSRGWPRSRR